MLAAVGDLLICNLQDRPSFGMATPSNGLKVISDLLYQERGAHLSQRCLTEVLSTLVDIQGKCHPTNPQLESGWPTDAAEIQIA